MSQNDVSPTERGTVQISKPKLVALGIGIAAFSVAATLALAPKQAATVTPTPDSHGATQTVTELVAVPDVCGLERQSAEKTITNARLDVGKETEEYSDTVHAGSVISQDPKPGTQANPDAKVNLVISKGRKSPEETTMPDLKGKSHEEAEQAITDAKLIAVQDADTVTKDVAPGLVCKQSIKAGTKVKQDTYVSYSIAIAPDTSVQVPNVAGEPLKDARKQLKDAGLAIDTTYAYSETVAKDCIISQSIDAGTKVAKDTPVTITVSMGQRQEGSLTVPNLAGMAANDAEKSLSDLGLASERAESYSDTVPAGNVIGQSIPAGTNVTNDTLVTLTVSLGSKPEPPAPPVARVTVPDIMTYTRDDTIATLKSAGLNERWSGEENGTVVAQDPPAGTEVDQGTVVTFKLEHVSSKVAVPDVSGMTVTDAGDGMESDQVLDGTDPVAGALVDEGTHVQAIPRDDSVKQNPPETLNTGDDQQQADQQTANQKDDQQVGQDVNQAQDQKGQQSDRQQDKPQQVDTTTDQGSATQPDASGSSADSQQDTLSKAIEVAGAKYEVVKTLTTTPANDGVNYTLLCHDDTGDYNVVIHVPSDGSSPSLVSATPATN